MGEIAEIFVPVPLKEKLKTIKNLPLPQKQLEEMGNAAIIGDKTVMFKNSLSSGVTNEKNNISLVLQLLELKDRSLKAFQPEKGTTLNVYVYDMAGKIVVKKKDKWEVSTPLQIQQNLPSGCYLIMAWAELPKGQKFGKTFYVCHEKYY